MPREFARHLRVGAELQRVLNVLLQDEVKDPRLRDVRVSEVDLSGDLGVAQIYFSILDPDADIASFEAALAKGAAFMRMRFGREIQLRRIPELRFAHDMSALQGQRISELIKGSVPPDSDDSPAED